MAEDPSLAASVRASRATGAGRRALRRRRAARRALSQRSHDPFLAARAADVRRSAAAPRGTSRTGTAVRAAARTATRSCVARDLGPADLAELELGAGRVVAGSRSPRARPRRTRRSWPARSGSRWWSASASVLARSRTATVLAWTATRARLVAPATPPSSTRARESMRESVRRRGALAARCAGCRPSRATAVAFACSSTPAPRPRSWPGSRRAPRASGCCAPSLRSSRRRRGRPRQQHCEALAPLLAPLARPHGDGADARLRRRQDAAVPRGPRSGALGARRSRSRRRSRLSCARSSARARERGCASCSRSSSGAAGAARRVAAAATTLGGRRHAAELGAMIETPRGRRSARRRSRSPRTSSRSARTTWCSTRSALDRDLPLASAATAADPAVLAHVASVVDAAHAPASLSRCAARRPASRSSSRSSSGSASTSSASRRPGVDLVRGVVRRSLPSARRRSRGRRSCPVRRRRGSSSSLR